MSEDDTVMEKNGVKLLIDPMSFQYLAGAEIDYQENAEGAQFIIKNPGASSTCGCGSSFSVYLPYNHSPARVKAEMHPRHIGIVWKLKIFR